MNRGFVPTASYAPLLDLNREWKIEAAVMPMDRAPVESDWMTVFHGRIDTIDPGGATIKVGGRDLGGKLADASEWAQRLVDALRAKGVTIQ